MKKIMSIIIIVMILLLFAITAYAEEKNELIEDSLIEFYDEAGVLVDVVNIGDDFPPEVQYPISAFFMDVIVNTGTDEYRIEINIDVALDIDGIYYDISDQSSIYLQIEVVDEEKSRSEKIDVQLVRKPEARKPQLREMTWVAVTENEKNFFVDNIMDFEDEMVIKLPYTSETLYLENILAEHIGTYMVVYDAENNMFFPIYDEIEIDMSSGSNYAYVKCEVDGAIKTYSLIFERENKACTDNTIESIVLDYIDKEGNYLKTETIECQEGEYDYSQSIDENCAGINIDINASKITAITRILVNSEEVLDGFITLSESNKVTIEVTAENQDIVQYNISLNNRENENSEQAIDSDTEDSTDNGISKWILYIGIVVLIAIMIGLVVLKKNEKEE